MASEPVLTKIAEQGVDELSPAIGFRDTIIVRHKATRHTINNDVLDLQALEKIARGFGKPDFELSVKLDKSETLVVSGFYVNEKDIQEGGLLGDFIQKSNKKPCYIA